MGSDLLQNDRNLSVEPPCTTPYIRWREGGREAFFYSD